jgi:leucyl aminopeptidase
MIQVDNALETNGAVVPIDLPSKRVVYAPTGKLDRDYDDVRRFSEAAEKGIKRLFEYGQPK